MIIVIRAESERKEGGWTDKKMEIYALLSPSDAAFKRSVCSTEACSWAVSLLVRKAVGDKRHVCQRQGQRHTLVACVFKLCFSQQSVWLFAAVSSERVCACGVLRRYTTFRATCAGWACVGKPKRNKFAWLFLESICFYFFKQTLPENIVNVFDIRDETCFPLLFCVHGLLLQWFCLKLIEMV